MDVYRPPGVGCVVSRSRDSVVRVASGRLAAVRPRTGLMTLLRYDVSIVPLNNFKVFE